jgi:uncharacterized damage-inducible protein DinB
VPFSQTLLPEFEEEMKNTRKLLECIPDGKLDTKPHAKSMTLAQVATHVAQIPGWTKFLLDQDVLDLSPDMKPSVVGSRAELLAMFDQGVADARGRIRAASDEYWQTTWTFKVGGSTVMSEPRAAVMRSMLMNPLPYRAQRCSGPVERAHGSAHLAPALEAFVAALAGKRLSVCGHNCSRRLSGLVPS